MDDNSDDHDDLSVVVTCVNVLLRTGVAMLIALCWCGHVLMCCVS